MKYRKMSFNCHNSLEVFGQWEDLKSFYIDNSTEDSILLGDEYFEVLDWDKDILEEKLDQATYIFMTIDGPPEFWLERIAKKYKKLEFNLIYQNRDNDYSGEIVYKNGELYFDSKYNEEELECVEVYN